jgi:cytochrome o ubiquinol oxidase subunit II
MKLAKKSLLYMLIFTAAIILIVLIMQPLSILHFGTDIIMLFPSGKIALEERNLLFIVQALMLLVIIPVYILTFIFSWKYSAENPKGTYDPDLVDNSLAEYIWWGLPLVMVMIVSALTWIKTEQLDPYKPLLSENKPLTIQVVALQWNWLFIYPEENVASMNFVQFPTDTPVHFEITSDAPMNSFWIPSLGGQIYAMPKMKTELHLIANEAGDFRGSSANISGEGFASMRFIARASSQEEYDHWLQSAKKSAAALDLEKFKKLSRPSINAPAITYQLKDPQLFHKILDCSPCLAN